MKSSFSFIQPPAPRVPRNRAAGKFSTSRRCRAARESGVSPFTIGIPSCPVAERELIDAIGEALGLAAPMAEVPKDRTLRAMTSLRVLLVEDNEVNCEVF